MVFFYIKNKNYLLILLLALISCSKPSISKKELIMDKIESVQQETWDKLTQRKIYFGHQSVGYNIINGLEFILKNNPNIKLNIIEDNWRNSKDVPLFIHARNGENGDPKSKIDSFIKSLNDGLAERVELAGFKFCYIDFNHRTDVDSVFEYYKNTIDKINQNFPNLEIIHYTVPLRTLQGGPKAWVKKMLNKSIGIEDNSARQKFNELLKAKYSKRYIFDIAKYESTYLDGKGNYTVLHNKNVYSLITEYSSDGGHLSELGKVVLGSQFLFFLSELP